MPEEPYFNKSRPTCSSLRQKRIKLFDEKHFGFHPLRKALSSQIIGAISRPLRHLRTFDIPFSNPPHA